MPRIDRDGVGIYYEVHGEGPPLLLTHGYSSTSAMWHGQVDALAGDHKLILWDMRGHGQSDYPDDPAAYSEALTVGDMAAILDAAGAERAIIGGLSLGGYMTLAFTRALPMRARALLIIDTGPGFKKDDAREAWNARALATADRLDREGLDMLKAATRERATASQSQRQGIGACRTRHADPARCEGDRAAAGYQGAGADRCRRRRHAVPRSVRLHGGENSRRAKGRDPRRRACRQHRSAAGFC
ncbi:pimeloyl-ACP methyl ester carboxylesterase [Bradyrhizobium sp. LB9.1b]